MLHSEKKRSEARGQRLVRSIEPRKGRDNSSPARQCRDNVVTIV